MLSMGFSRQEYWSGLPCPSPGDLPNPGIELASPVALALQVDSLPLSQWGGPTGSSRGSFASQGTLVSVWRLKKKHNLIIFNCHVMTVLFTNRQKHIMDFISVFFNFLFVFCFIYVLFPVTFMLLHHGLILLHHYF